MATTQTPRGRSRDRAKVAGGQNHELEYEAGKTGAKKAEVKAAVKSVGNNRKKVETSSTRGSPGGKAMVRIATFNVNGVNGRLPVLLRWLNATSYDVVCLQELKTSDEKFPADALRNVGYGAIWHGQKSYNGVAILSRGVDPVERRRGLPGDPDDTHSRYIEADVGGILIGCLYLPNGNPAPGPKFDYKLRWFDRLIGYGRGLVKNGGPAVLCGDYNVVPTPIDAVAPRRWVGDAVYFPESRQAYAQMLETGWVDSVRQIHPEKGIYTYWNHSYRGGYDKSSGLRMDHLLISPSLAPRLRDAGVDVESRGWEKPSDHAPAWIELDAAEVRPRA